MLSTQLVDQTFGSWGVDAYLMYANLQVTAFPHTDDCTKKAPKGLSLKADDYHPSLMERSRASR